MESNKVKVLSLNGGGVRGYYTLCVLAKLEEILAEKTKNSELAIGSYFDVITGTSIGGIMALALSDGKKARDLAPIFESYAPKIFPPTLIGSKRIKKAVGLYKLVFGHLYKTEELKKCIVEILGAERQIGDLTRRTIIPTVNVTTGLPLLFKTPHNSTFTRDKSISLVDVALSTSAAPTYFKPHFIESLNSYFVDGGLIANNSSLLAFHEINEYFDEPKFQDKNIEIDILNIGTLSSKFCLDGNKIRNKPGYLRLWGMGENLIETVMSANQSMHSYMVSRAVN